MDTKFEPLKENKRLQNLLLSSKTSISSITNHNNLANSYGNASNGHNHNTSKDSMTDVNPKLSTNYTSLH